MTARAYIAQLAKVLVVFGVVIPGLAAGTLWLAGRDTGIGLSYFYYFIGMPLWIIAVAVALWRTARRRVAAVGLPYVVSLCFIPLVLADWMAVMSFFQEATPMFLLTAGLMLVALMVWPARQEGAGKPARWFGIARHAAIAGLAAQTALATVSVIGSIARAITVASPTFLMQFGPLWYARYGFVVVLVTQVVAIAAAWRWEANRQVR